MGDGGKGKVVGEKLERGCGGGWEGEGCWGKNGEAVSRLGGRRFPGHKWKSSVGVGGTEKVAGAQPERRCGGWWEGEGCWGTNGEAVSRIVGWRLPGHTGNGVARIGRLNNRAVRSCDVRLGIGC